MAKKIMEQASSIEGKSPDELLVRAYHVEGADDTIRLYRDWAETYDDHLVEGLGYTLPLTVAGHFSAIIEQRALRVLDIGCGTGLTGQALSNHDFEHIDGLDFSPDMLVEARKKGIYGTLIEADLTGVLAIESASYDAAISSGTFTEGHVGAEAFDEIFRILKPGACFITSINMEIWKNGGFEKKIDQLVDLKIMRVEQMIPTHAFEGGEDHFQIATLMKM